MTTAGSLEYLRTYSMVSFHAPFCISCPLGVAKSSSDLLGRINNTTASHDCHSLLDGAILHELAVRLCAGERGGMND